MSRAAPWSSIGHLELNRSALADKRPPGCRQNPPLEISGRRRAVMPWLASIGRSGLNCCTHRGSISAPAIFAPPRRGNEAEASVRRN